MVAKPNAETSPCANTAGHEPSLVTFGSSGRGQEGGYIEFGPDETWGRLEIIVQSGSRIVAGGVISVEELWQVNMLIHHTLTLRVYLFDLVFSLLQSHHFCSRYTKAGQCVVS